MAFPTTAILDTFNRANENPIGGNWTNNALNEGANNQLKIVSNQCQAVTVGTSCEAYWNASSFTGDKEAYFKVITKPGNGQRFEIGFLQSPGTSNYVGYRALFIDNSGTGNDTVIINRTDTPATDVQLASVTNEFSANDILGISISASGVIKVWQNGNQIATATDTTYTGAFYIELGIRDTTGVVDDFGGGVIIKKLAALGVG